ncbi:BapA/Bap/LapF family large adhesin [Sphingobium rhizovicinum]|uniref:BapA/Bap/LapF family large adhesin n=1 Tax=Sphingobium rhizovicinum TaxID=432308 RepID=A0ABV7NHW4_9SPHN
MNAVGTILSGTAEANATIEIRDADGNLLGSGLADGDGNYAITLDVALDNGETVSVTQIDAAGNISLPTLAVAPDLTSPTAPDAALDGVNSVIGTGEPGALVTVYDAAGAVLGTARVGSDGNFQVALSSPQNNGETLTVRQTDGAGNVSDPVQLIAPDGTAPLAPTALVAVDGLTVTGTAEAGATVRIFDAAGVLIGTAIALGDGSYAATLDMAQTNGQLLSVIQSDAAGNSSAPTVISAPDLDAPIAPVASVTADGLAVIGTGEAGAIIEVRDGSGALLGSGVVRPDGGFSITLNPPLTNGEALAVTQVDGAGNVSDPTPIVAPDLTAPDAPTGVIAANGGSISGTGEAGATISVTDASGAVIGTAIVDGDGDYVVLFDPALVDGQVLGIVQSDVAGNVSTGISVIAPDFTPPPAPTATIDGTGTVVTGSVITGEGVAGSTIEVRAADGTLLGTGIVDAQGNYTVTLNAPQVDGEALAVTQVDGAGNVSDPTPIVAPDLTAPDAPTGVIAANGGSISGTGEAGATISVTDAGGAVIGTAIVDGDGDYVVLFDPALVDGQVLGIVQSDVAGNVSTGISVIAPDFTPPPAPTATIDGTGTVVTGSVITGEGVAGSTIEVRAADGTLLGTGIVDAQGNYTVTLNAPQVDGEALAVTQVDGAGNVSDPTPIVAPDLTAPDAPTGVIAANGGSISGTGEAGATISVTDAGGAVIGTAIVDGDGDYVVLFDPALVDGQMLGIVQSDVAGNVSTGISVIAPDLTPPPAPTATIDGTGTVVTGSVITGEGVAGSTIEVRAADGTLLGTGIVDAQGNYTVTLNAPQVDGEALAVTQVDGAGNVSDPTPIVAPDLTAPDAPTGVIAANGGSISGMGEAGATISVTDASGAVIGTAIVDGDGDYVVLFDPALVDGQVLGIVQSDVAGNVSTGISVIAPDFTPPPAPTATIDGSGTVVTGVGVAGSTIEVRAADNSLLGSGIVNAQGNYTVMLTPPQVDSQPLTVTQMDAANNVSAPINLTAPDLTAPEPPTAIIAGDGASMTGTGEVGATISVRDPAGVEIGTAIVDADGNWSSVLTPAQVHGEPLTVVQSDVAGNISAELPVTAPNLNTPDAPDPVTAIVTAGGVAVTGTGEAGATVTVTGPGGVPLGSAIVEGDGTYSVTLNPAQANGEKLVVIQTDTDGLSSVPVIVTAPDITPPAMPTAQIDATGAAVSGSGEKGATVTVRDADGAVIGTATVDGQGHFVVMLSPAQIDGASLSVTQSDATGNESDPAIVVTPDLTAPDAPTGTVAGDGATVTGNGEAGATITVTDAAGIVLGTGTVAVNGSFTVALTPSQANGEVLTLVQADAAGNLSAATTITAPDTTAPADPNGSVTSDGTAVIGSGEAGATISVTNAAGTVLGTAIVGANGSFIVTLASPQVNGETLGLIQTDGAGNASTRVDVVAPDITAPDAPTGAITADGTTVNGTGEAGAMISITGVGGALLGTGVVAANGSYSVTLTPTQANGQALTLVQVDAAGNISPSLPITAPDITAPDAPTGTVASDGILVTGTGEPGATISITDPAGLVIGTAIVAANGSYVVSLATPQLNGQMLGIIQTDAAGNASAEFDLIAPDSTAPTAPTGTIRGDGAVITGTGEAGATITVTNAAGTALGTTIVAGNGSYSVTLTPAQTNGEALTLVQSDAGGNVSPQLPIIAPDITAPDAPTGTITADGSTVTGTGEAGATINITDPAGAVIGTAIVGTNGSYVATLTTPQLNGETLGLIQTDAAGNISTEVDLIAPDVTPPAAPTGTVRADGAVVTGTGEAGAAISITDPAGIVIGTTTVAGNGSYSVTLTTPQVNGETLGIVQADSAGNVSPRVPAIAPDITPPAAPTGAVTADGAIVNGTGEAGATISITDPAGSVIGTAIVASNGNYSVTLTTPQVNGETLGITQRDAAGNVSPAASAVAPDVTPPAAPTGSISIGGTIVTGSGEAGATIRISNAVGVLLATAIVAANGSYSATLPTAQTNGERLTLIQVDAAGNASSQVPLIAPDTTPPAAPTAAISANGGTVTGSGEAGATITVRGADGSVLGSALVAANGSYSVALNAAQLNGQQLSVSQSDAAGNASPNVGLTAPDHTPPDAPTAIISGTGAVITGTGEVGATITITNAAGVVIGSAIVAANGSYSVTLTQAQANGETVGIIQTDQAGNASAQTNIVAPDITPPPAPANLAVDASGTTLTGIGEAGATVRVRDGNGTLIGTAQVGDDGRFSVILSSPQIGGENLTVTQTDLAGNPSIAATVGAPFDIAAFDNSAIALIDLLPVSTAVNHGSANYTALVSLDLLNLNLQVLGTPSVGFTVADGHSFNAVFTYDATLTIGALSGYTVAVQRWNGSQWVAVDGGSGVSLVQLNLLNGNLVSTETLGPGQYRAFAAFEGTLGLGLLGDLHVTGTDVDFTDIGGVVPQQIHGNVITDPSADGHVDIISPQTQIQSVTVNGVTTAVNANGTIVNGAFGRLVINLDGSYSYTPSPSAASIGKSDIFQYQLIDRSDGETETANLIISIGSDDISAAPVASHDSATAAVQYHNVVTTVPTAQEFSFSTPILSTRSGSDTFSVAANSQADITITVIRAGTIAVLPSYTITVRNAANVVVGTHTATAIAGLPLGSGISHTFEDLPAGNYSYTVSSTNTLGLAYNSTVYIGETITHLDQYSVSSVTGTQGELLANDTTGTPFVVVKVGTGSGFVEVGETPITVNATYGTLTVNETGHYSYTPGTAIAHSTVNLVDSFTYQIVQPNGVSATATLDVTINVATGAASSLLSVEQASLLVEDVVVPTEDTHAAASLMSNQAASEPDDGASPAVEIASLSSGDLILAATQSDAVDPSDPMADSMTPDTGQAGAIVSDEVLGELAYQMFEGQGALEDVLSAYLDDQPSSEQSGPVEDAAPVRDSVDLTPVDLPQDPLSYLASPDDIEKSQNNGHQF